MHSVVDTIRHIGEKSTERMNFRTKPRIKQTIQRAAALSGMDDSAFTINAAYQATLATINSHERTAPFAARCALRPVRRDQFVMISGPISAVGSHVDMIGT